MSALTAEYKALWRLGLPVLVTQAGIIIVSFADTIMVGAYGTAELAAAAFVNSIFMIAVVCQIGFAAGMTPLIGSLYGQGDKAEAGATLRAGLVVNSCTSLAFTAIMGVMYFFLDYFGQPAELMPLIKSYYLIILCTLLPMAVFNCCQQTANGTTDTATPMWMILMSNVINIVGNYMLIYGKWGAPELGLVGAGIATAVARLAAAVGILAVFFSTRRYRDYVANLGYRRELAGRRRWRVWVTSYPIMIQSGIECSMWAFGAIVCGWFGKIQLAAYQVVNTIGQLGFMIYMSFGVALSVRVANFSGQGNMDRARLCTRAALHMILALATVASAVFIIGGANLIHIFTPDGTVIASALTLVLPLVLYQYCDAAQLTYANALRGISVVKPLAWASIISYIVIGTPCLLLLARTLGLGNVGVYYSFCIALAAAALFLFLAYRRAMRERVGWGKISV